MASWQQVLALDAKFNNFRAPNNPSFKRLYLRRRNHLLRNSSQFKNDKSRPIPEICVAPKTLPSSSSLSPSLSGSSNGYLQIRTILLQQKYKVSLDQLSHRSSRPPSRIIHVPEVLNTSGSLNSAARSSIAASGFGSSESRGCAAGVVPTNRARASRAIVGGTTLGENYAFSGVHHIFDQHKGAITMLKFGHNDSSILACSSVDGTVSICKADETKPIVLHRLELHKTAVMGVVWCSSNDLLASCSSDGLLCVWQADTGECLRQRQPAKPGASALACLFHPINTNWIVVGGGDGHGAGEVQVVVLSTGLTVRGGCVATPAPVTALAFNAHGTTLWAADQKGNITAFRMDAISGSLRKGRRTSVTANKVTSPSTRGFGITNLEHRTWASREARDPSLLVSAACNLLLLYSVADEYGGLSLRRQLAVSHSKYDCLRATFPPLMSFHEGAAVVSGSEDGNVLFLDTERTHRPLINKLQGHSAAVLCPAFNYTESLLATGDASGIVIVWKRRSQN